ncbi:MAG: cyclic-di-AMP receptor [Acholeplasmatales bacterium]|jgi:uncharacterized protein YaaQ|nr:cyclic-di-AMP receptor [Acholeplasmatales bacterium]
MKLIIAVVNQEDSKKVHKVFVENRIFSTKLSSSGNFLSSGQVTYMIGAEDKRIDEILDVLRNTCKKRIKIVPSTILSEFHLQNTVPIEVEVGGATIFILEVSQFFKI